jgi:hypothetical protein
LEDAEEHEGVVDLFLEEGDEDGGEAGAADDAESEREEPPAGVGKSGAVDGVDFDGPEDGERDVV